MSSLLDMASASALLTVELFPPFTQKKCTEIFLLCAVNLKGTASEFSLCAFSKPTCNPGVSGRTRRLKLLLCKAYATTGL